MDTEANPVLSPSLQDRQILTQIGDRRLAFPSSWVAEILLIERSQILNLPFYDPIILGVVHHHGQTIPLIAIQQVFEGTVKALRETISVVQLSMAAGDLAGVGIVVDRALESQISETSTESPSWAAAVQPTESLIFFRPTILSDRLWKPQRWFS